MADFSSRLNKVIPGGCHTYSRGDDQYPINAPQILEKGKGAYVWDPEGNKYLDYGMALRAVTLGYDYERVSDAAIKQIRYGNNLTRASLVELEAAEVMVDLFEGMDMIKFAKNGSSVTTAATKISRAYTGRKMIARCAQHPFFSFDDWFIGDTPLTRGIPKEEIDNTVNFNFNDIESLELLFSKYKNQIACVILEPATTIEPIDKFLHKVKDLCHENGAVFILDEMITGFRFGLQGAQKYYNIIPDLCTFGKGMANGFSVAALMGKREIMEIGGIKNEGAERVFLVSTTHGAEMCGLGALVETIKVIQEENVIEHFWSYGKKLIDGMNLISEDLGLSEYFYVEGMPVNPNYICKDKDGISLPLRTLFSQEMIRNGVLMPWIAISYAHGEKELDITLKAVRNALSVYKEALGLGVDQFLEGDAIKPVFRKYN